MKMKIISFKNPKAQRSYQTYLKQVGKALKGTDIHFKNQMLNEINNHIFEGLPQNMESDSEELEKLQDILQELGNPNDYLQEIVAEHKLDTAIKRFNPLGILSSLYHFAKSSVKYTIYFFLYLFLGSILILIVTKIINPEQTGLFFKNDSFYVLGISHLANSEDEVLGYWFIPAMVLLFLLLFFMLTLLLRFSRRKKKQDLHLKF